MMKTQDRISFSFGMKLSLPTKYESADFHVSLTTDVNENETLDQAYLRARTDVLRQTNKLYQEIKESEQGLLDVKPKNEGNGEALPAVVEDVKAPAQAVEAKPRDPKILRQKVKAAFGVLESQKLITKEEFRGKYLKGKKTDELTELEVTRVIVDLREAFPKLNL